MTAVDRSPYALTNTWYVTNKAILRPNARVRLPTGGVHPIGWLWVMLRSQADGSHGHEWKVLTGTRKSGGVRAITSRQERNAG